MKPSLASPFPEGSDTDRHMGSHCPKGAIPGLPDAACQKLLRIRTSKCLVPSERVELHAGECHRHRAGARPHKFALVQPTRRQRHADAIVHEHLHAVGTRIGKEVGGVRMGCTKCGYDSRQCCIGPCAHVHGGAGQPYGVDTDNLSTAAVQLAMRCTPARSRPQWRRQGVGRLPPVRL